MKLLLDFDNLYELNLVVTLLNILQDSPNQELEFGSLESFECILYELENIYPTYSEEKMDMDGDVFLRKIILNPEHKPKRQSET